MARVGTWVAWFWPSIIVVLLAGLSLIMPGGPEIVVILGLLALQGLVFLYKITRWVVAEANARSAQ